MANLLNYKYEIFPTAPQRQQLDRVLRQSRLQWNRAVTIRRKLKAALLSGQFAYLLESFLLSGKNDNQANRKKAILKFQADTPAFSSLDFESSARLYDIKNIVGKLFDIETRHLDLAVLAGELKALHSVEMSAYKEAKAQGVEPAKRPKRPIFWRMMEAINRHAGFAAKTYMDESFESPKAMALSTVRFNISGSANSVRWNQAVQRAYGARGEPQYKKRGSGEGFAYQIQNMEPGDLINPKSNGGRQIHIKALHKGNAQVDMAYHRPLPKGCKIKALTVNKKAGRYFVVLSAEVPDSAWLIAPMEAGWRAGIDPGASTALTVALQNANSGELAHLAIHYGFLDKSMGRLEKIQQRLSHMHGPMRERTEDEIQEALKNYPAKSEIKKLTVEERDKEIAKKDKWLRSTKVRNAEGMSNRWRRWANRVSALQFTIANQRADVLHKISRALAEGCDVVGLGDWEPVREVSYRKKIRAAKKKMRLGVEGAELELKTLEEEKSKQGPKGIKKVRRGGRDRSIASLRSLLEEKSKRAGTYINAKVKEAGSTYTCCACDAHTGPRNDTSIRVWRCEKCGTTHLRDLNSGFNILRKTDMEIAAAQAAALETGLNVTRSMNQGATDRPVREDRFRATGSSRRGDSFFYEHAYETALNLWDKEVPKALKSLIQMGIARPLDMQKVLETGSQGHPEP